jgi:hypothetical protein
MEYPPSLTQAHFGVQCTAFLYATLPLHDIFTFGPEGHGFIAQCRPISPLLKVKHFVKLVHTHCYTFLGQLKCCWGTRCHLGVEHVILRNQQVFLALSNYFPATDLKRSSLSCHKNKHMHPPTELSCKINEFPQIKYKVTLNGST